MNIVLQDDFQDLFISAGNAALSQHLRKVMQRLHLLGRDSKINHTVLVDVCTILKQEVECHCVLGNHRLPDGGHTPLIGKFDVYSFF